MIRRAFSESRLVRVVLAASLICIGASASGTKSPAPAAKPASAPAKPAAPAAKPASGGTAPGAPGARGATTHGPTTGGATTHGPTTGGATTHGPTTGGATTHGPAAGNPGGGGRGTGSAISHPAPAGSHTTHAPNGADVQTRANGTRSDLHDPKRGMDVHRNLNGNRVTRVERPDHSRIVSERGGRGYYQRPYAFRGHEFEHRTYYAHGRAYDRFYRPYGFRGVALEVYAPARYYPLGYYGWVYNPWMAPVPFAWGFAASPWYGYYGVYFTPQPVYPSASYWLTDYMISNSLQNAYQAGVDAGQQMQPLQAGPTPPTPDVKSQISAEVQLQIALENQEAQATAQNQDVNPQSSGIARMLGDGASHVFVGGHDLDLVNSAGQECMVTPGDVLQLRAPQPATGGTVSLLVLASKGGQECGKASTVSVALNDLQDMQNHMRETIDQGLGELQAKQGKGGLPAEPVTAAGAATAAPFTQGAPPPDPNIAAEIAQQAQEADRAEAEAGQTAQVKSGGPSDSPAAPPKEVSLGMTQQEVTSILGAPRSIVTVTALKKMFVYADMKVTFNSGRVADIQ